MTKSKLLAYLTAFLVCQAIAALIWFIFRENYFVVGAVVSILVITTSYKENKVKE